MQRLTEAGIIRKWELDTVEAMAARGRRRRGASSAKADSRFLPLSIFHVQGAFIVLTAGYAAGLLTLLVEALAARCARKRKVRISGG